MKNKLTVLASLLLSSLMIFGCSSGDNNSTATDVITDNTDNADSNETVETKTEETIMTEDNISDSDLWTAGYGSSAIVYTLFDETSGKFNGTLYMGGYNQDFPATGKLDDQYARAIYLSDGSTGIIMCSIDCVGMGEADIKNIRSKVKDLTDTGIILHVASTHDHAGIDTLGLWGPAGIDGKNDEFMEQVYSAAERAIRMAAGDCRKGKLYFGYSDTGDIQYDSRLPNVYDRNIYRIRFEPQNGGSGIQVISYTSHAESLRGANTLVSADFPCYMGRNIKEKTGDDFLFFASSVGGLVMTKVQTKPNGEEYPIVESCKLTGEYLADCVLSISNEIELKPSLEHKSESVDINLENELFIAMSALDVLSARPVKGTGDTGLALRTSVSAVRLGGSEGVIILMTPGELFSELVTGEYDYSVSVNPDVSDPPSLKSIFEGQGKLIVYGLCDDEIGYVVTPSDFLLNPDTPWLDKTYDDTGRRHYEETNSVGRDTAWFIYDTALKLKF